jgi:hypothetical protein
VTTEEHIQTLRDALKADYATRIAEVEAMAEQAAAEGQPTADLLREYAERLRAIPLPGQAPTG